AGGGRIDDLDADDALGARLVEQARDLEAGESVAPGELDLRHTLEVVLAREGDLERDRVRGPGPGAGADLRPETRLRPGSGPPPGARLLAPHRFSLHSLHRPLR